MNMQNLERGGWEPGLHWVADGPEQQKELDLRYEAERIADQTQRLRSHIRIEDTSEEPYNREESVQRVISLLAAQESYINRPLAEVLGDTLSWIDAVKGDRERYNARHTLMREASSLLWRTADFEAEKEDVDPELLGMAVKWSAIEYFTYWYYRDWPEKGITPQSSLELIKKTGISEGELVKLLDEPIDDQTEQLLDGEDVPTFHFANQLRLETQILQRAKELGLEVGKAHGYGNYLQAWGV